MAPLPGPATLVGIIGASTLCYLPFKYEGRVRGSSNKDAISEGKGNGKALEEINDVTDATGKGDVVNAIKFFIAEQSWFVVACAFAVDVAVGLIGFWWCRRRRRPEASIRQRSIDIVDPSIEARCQPQARPLGSIVGTWYYEYDGDSLQYTVTEQLVYHQTSTDGTIFNGQLSGAKDSTNWMLASLSGGTIRLRHEGGVVQSQFRQRGQTKWEQVITATSEAKQQMKFQSTRVENEMLRQITRLPFSFDQEEYAEPEQKRDELDKVAVVSLADKKAKDVAAKERDKKAAAFCTCEELTVHASVEQCDYAEPLTFHLGCKVCIENKRLLEEENERLLEEHYKAQQEYNRKHPDDRHHEEAAELEVVFEPRTRVGIDADWQIGLVTRVDKADQAHRLGVRVGMRLSTVTGKPYTKDRYDTAKMSHHRFKVTFAQELLRPSNAEPTPSSPSGLRSRDIEVFGSAVRDPEVEVTEVLFSSQAHLYRFENNEWKQRGVGDAKIGKLSTMGEARFLMRDESAERIVCNVLITDECNVIHVLGKNEELTFSAEDVSGKEPAHDRFALKFSTEESARAFKEAVDRAKKQNGGAGEETPRIAAGVQSMLSQLLSPRKSSSSSSQKSVEVNQSCADASAEAVATPHQPGFAKVQQTGRTGKIVEHNPDCGTFTYKLEFSDGSMPQADWFARTAVVVGGDDETPEQTGSVVEPEVYDGAAEQPEHPEHSKSAECPSKDPQHPTAAPAPAKGKGKGKGPPPGGKGKGKAPVASAPPGEDGEDVVHCQRGKLYRKMGGEPFSKIGAGEAQILKDRKTGLVRFSMANDQTKIAIASCLMDSASPYCQLTPIQGNQLQMTWLAQDLLQKANDAHFAIRLDTVEDAKKFQQAFDAAKEIQSQEAVQNAVTGSKSAGWHRGIGGQ